MISHPTPFPHTQTAIAGQFLRALRSWVPIKVVAHLPHVMLRGATNVLCASGTCVQCIQFPNTDEALLRDHALRSVRCMQGPPPAKRSGGTMLPGTCERRMGCPPLTKPFGGVGLAGTCAQCMGYPPQMEPFGVTGGAPAPPLPCGGTTCCDAAAVPLALRYRPFKALK